MKEERLMREKHGGLKGWRNFEMACFDGRPGKTERWRWKGI